MSATDRAHPRGPASVAAEQRQAYDDRRAAADVEAARAGVGRAGVTYGARPPGKPPRGSGPAWLREFVRRYGWRAYAVPVLLVVTVVALMTSSTVASRHRSTAAPVTPATAKAPVAPPVAGDQMSLHNDTPAGKVDDTVLKAAALPAGPAYTLKGTGTFRVLKGTTPVVGKGKLFRYSIEVENGINDIDLTQYAETVVKTLSDPQSWSGHGVSLERVDSGPVDFHISLTSSMTVRKLCGYSIPVETSCYAPAGSANGLTVNRVVFNDSRWVRGSAAYVGDLATYRTYMINHEDGHALGHEHAHQCLPGGLAPVMMQQTFGLRSAATDKMCQANPWPYPTGVKGTPGAEQPDTPANDEYGLGD